tara:strand:+ start:88 stop:1215 length:1128 start_codon:yes stop_codon:yes gene_type:complete
VAIEEFRKILGYRPGQVHLNNAGLAPMTLPAQRAIAEMSELLVTDAFHQVEKMIMQYEEARSSFGKLVGVPGDNVAMTQTCAAAISQVAFGLDLRADDEIIRWDQEYPSNAYPWHAAASQKGAKVEVIPSEKNLELSTDRLLDAINPKTRVVAISWVQYQTGSMTDLKRVSQACRQHDAWLVVDGIQGLGVIPFDMKEMGVDALCGGTHKWLCGPFGHGFLALADGRAQELIPVLQGAITYGTPDEAVILSRSPRPDARRFEPGSPVLLGAVGGAASIEALLEIGIDRINREALRLSNTLSEKLKSIGARILSSPREEGQSPILTVQPAQSLESAATALKKASVAFGVRGGGIRLAPHGFNTEEDLDTVLDALGS